MKRFVLLMLCLLTLCACSAAPSREEADALTALLTEIDSTVQPGTAGSSLRSANLAAQLMDWSRDTTLTSTQIIELAQQAAASARTDHPASFEEKMQSVYNAYSQLMTPAGEGLLRDCGYNGDGFPWAAEDMGPLETVIKAVGPS